jgi:hypothetical protein
MPDNKDTTHKDVLERLLEQKKAAGSKVPEHTEFGAKAGIQRADQFANRPQRPGGNRGRG